MAFRCAGTQPPRNCLLFPFDSTTWCACLCHAHTTAAPLWATSQSQRYVPLGMELDSADNWVEGRPVEYPRFARLIRPARSLSLTRWKSAMSSAASITADGFFGKALAIEGLATWARSRIEQAKNDWRCVCLLRALNLLLWFTFLRPFRRAGLKSFESVQLGSLSVSLAEINESLDQLLRSGDTTGYSARILFCGIFRTIRRYRGELGMIASAVAKASQEWDQAVSYCCSEAIEGLRANALAQDFSWPQEYSDTCPIESSLPPSELRAHLGQVVLRS